MTDRRTGDVSLWGAAEAGRYESENYGPGLAGWVLRKSHELVERPFGPGRKFPRVLEVGAGSGIHLRYVRHDYDSYLMTDGSESMLAQMQPAVASARRPERVALACEQASSLSFADASFDRVIATHVLEHVPAPQDAVREWARVVEPGGVLSIVLPCDPGLAWRAGRSFGPRSRARDRGLPYDYVMALEHVNAIFNLVAIIRHLFPQRRETWWPSTVGLADLNLIWAVNVTVHAGPRE